MGEPADDRIILCQPDNLKGCSLCCGLFNFSDLSKGFLAEFLSGGLEREKRFSTHEGFNTSGSERDRFSHICPYQGFLGSGKPGCLVHPLSSGDDGRDRSLFASRICDRFFCSAHSILSKNEKIFLIQNVDDWYLYSTAIADPESYSCILDYVKQYFDKWDDSDFTAALVKEGLTAHAENLANYKGTVFFYSIPEYNLNKMNFGIRYNKENESRVISRIKNMSI